MSGKTNYEPYRAARDPLMLLGGRPDGDLPHFWWPARERPFNWAHDWFDRLAAIHHSSTAPPIVEEGGASNRYSYERIGLPLRSDLRATSR